MHKHPQHVIIHIFALVILFTLSGHNSTPLSSQKLSVAPLESSRRDAHNSKNVICERSDTTRLSFSIFVLKEFAFRGHEGSNTAKIIYCVIKPVSK